MSGPRCSRRGCHAVRVQRPDGKGAIAWECTPCLRNAMGYCRDCPRILEDPNAWRCARCRKKQKSKRQGASRRRRFADDPVLAKRESDKKRRLRADPIEGEKIRQRSRERYAAKVAAGKVEKPDNFDRAYKRAWYRSAAEDPAFLEQYAERRRERYRNDPAYREAKKQATKERYRRLKAERAATKLAAPIEVSAGESRRAS